MRLSPSPAMSCTIASICLSLLPACTVVSPYWGYVPDSTSAPIPFTAYTPQTTSPVVVECATDTTAHGSPTNGEASYTLAASISVSTYAQRDTTGATMNVASQNVTLPASCWKYFGDYDFWQANVRVSQVQTAPTGGTTKRIFTNHDLAGLTCLGRENGAAGTWLGFVGKGCEHKFLGSENVTPYIVMRIEGYAEGLASAASASMSTPASARARVKLAAPAANLLSREALNVLKATPITQADLANASRAR